MLHYIVISIISGILFGVLDGVIHANPAAQRLYEVYKPIAKTSLNPLTGILIDLAYGFIMAAIFLFLYPSLPGESGSMKGMVFGLLVWFFRVVMSAASTGMMFNVPIQTITYDLVTGLGEMLLLGLLYGLTLRPQSL